MGLSPHPDRVSTAEGNEMTLTNQREREKVASITGFPVTESTRDSISKIRWE